MLPAHPPDRLEYVIHFFFGAFAGLVISFCMVMSDKPLTVSKGLLEFATPALILGALAAWLGDRFWRVFLRLFH